MAKKEEEYLKKLTKAMEEVQSGKRFTHTLGVEYTACALAMKHDVPLFSAQLAGLFERVIFGYYLFPAYSTATLVHIATPIR